jgi:secreted trypsin-like serine protease
MIMFFRHFVSLLLLIVACNSLPTSLTASSLPKCGVKSVTTDLRIVGGEPSVANEWPWQVSLQSSFAGSLRHFCGATIINDEWILTAAHCTDNRLMPSLWTIKLGKVNLARTEENERVFKVEKVSLTQI